MLAATPAPVPGVAPSTFARPAPRAASGQATASHYVHPGRLLTGEATGDFTTVVGSGAVVCAWDPVANVAGMAHFLLPEKGNAPAAPRFGDVALAQLIDELEKMGGNRARLRASLFGGSAPPIVAESGHLGERNVQQALGFLAAHAIPVQQKDVGGTGGRKVVFAPAAGTASVVRLAG